MLSMPAKILRKVMMSNPVQISARCLVGVEGNGLHEDEDTSRYNGKGTEW